MTDETPEPESMPMWIAMTAVYMFLAVFATIVLVNAFQSFFWERVWLPVTGSASAAMGAFVAQRRWRRLARLKQENIQ